MCMLRRMLFECDPELRECYEYGMPVYRKGRPLMAMWRSSDHVNLGFIGGAGLLDEHGMMEGRAGEHRHVKLFSPRDLARDLLELIELSVNSADPDDR